MNENVQINLPTTGKLPFPLRAGCATVRFCIEVTLRIFGEQKKLTKQTHHVVIPDAIMDDLDIKDGEQVEVTLKDKEAVIRPKRADTGTQTISLRFFLIPTVLAGIVFLAYFFYFNILQVPMTGKNSIAQMVIVLGELSGMGTFAVTYIRNHRQIHGRDHRRRYWRIFPDVAAVICDYSSIRGVGVFLGDWLYV